MKTPICWGCEWQGQFGGWFDNPSLYNDVKSLRSLLAIQKSYHGLVTMWMAWLNGLRLNYWTSECHDLHDCFHDYVFPWHFSYDFFHEIVHEFPWFSVIFHDFSRIVHDFLILFPDFSMTFPWSRFINPPPQRTDMDPALRTVAPGTRLQLIRQLLGEALLHCAEELRGFAHHLAEWNWV